MKKYQKYHKIYNKIVKLKFKHGKYMFPIKVNMYEFDVKIITIILIKIIQSIYQESMKIEV